MHKDLMECVTQKKSEIVEVGGRVVEKKMAEFAHNELVDAYYEKDEVLEILKNKMVDLEDR